MYVKEWAEATVSFEHYSDINPISDLKYLGENPVILKINAMDAYNHGVKFYNGNQKVWLADNIPIQFIEKNNET